MTLIPAETLNAEGLSNHILKTQEKHHIDPMLMVSQGYDGAAVMSGHCLGASSVQNKTDGTKSFVCSLQSSLP